MATDIQVTSLTADGGLGKVTLVAIAIPPAGKECLAYMQPTKIEFWASNTNNRASAVKVGESTTGFFEHTGLPDTVARYYWARAVDLDGNLGAYYPVSATAGVAAVTKTTIPEDGSITTPKLADGAVTDIKIASMTASKLTAGTVTVTISFTSPIINGGTITGGLFRTAATGRRIEMDGSINYVKVYNSAGALVGTLGEISPLDPLFAITRDVPYNNAVISNPNPSGRAMVVTGRVDFTPAVTGAFDVTVMEVVNNKTSNNAHAARFYNPNTGGGHLVAGISAGGGGYAANAQVGGFYSAAGYFPFTGCHETVIRKDAEIAVGDIVRVKRIIARNGLSNVLAEVERTELVGDRAVIGVVSEIKELPMFSQIAALGDEPRDRSNPTPIRRYLSENFFRVAVNALGEGQMDVCGRGGDIGAGDYIVSSDLPGKGQRLDMNQPVTFGLQAAIVAQTMEPVTFAAVDQVRRIAVFYRCG